MGNIWCSDHEFAPGGWFCFIDWRDMHVKVGRIHPANGYPDLAFQTLDNSGTALEQYIPLPLGNGPEWGQSLDGWHVDYMVRVAGVPKLKSVLYDPATEAWQAPQDVAGAVWDTDWCGGVLGSINPSAHPRIVYLYAHRDAPLEGRCSHGPGLSDCTPVAGFCFGGPTGGGPARPIPGTQDLLMTVPVQGTAERQLARVDPLDTSTPTLISEPLALPVNSLGVIDMTHLHPEAYLYYVLLNNDRVHVYLPPQYSDPPLVGPVNVIPAPTPFCPDNTLWVDEENFSFQDEPYITITMGTNAENPAFKSEMWIAHAFGNWPEHYRRVSCGRRVPAAQRPGGVCRPKPSPGSGCLCLLSRAAKPQGGQGTAQLSAPPRRHRPARLSLPESARLASADQRRAGAWPLGVHTKEQHEKLSQGTKV